MNTSFNIVYSVEIIDTERVPNISTTETDVVNYATSRFNPRELYGFASVGKCLTYAGKILYVDDEKMFNETELFSAKFIDTRTFNVHSIIVDKNKLIKESVYNSIAIFKEICDTSDNKSKYIPMDILNLYCNNSIITYNKLVVYIDTISSSDNKLYGKFIDKDLIPCQITVDAEKNISIEKIENNYKSFIDVSSKKYQAHELTAMADRVIFTYNGNVLYMDKNLSSPSKFYGFYLDGFDMIVYRVSVDESKNVYHETHKKIIKQVNIDGSNLPVNTYVIDGDIDCIDYHIKNIKSLTFNWDKRKHFETWVTIDATGDDCILNFPTSNTNKPIFIRDEVLEKIDKGHIRELSIKDGVIVSGPVGEEWMDF